MTSAICREKMHTKRVLLKIARTVVWYYLLFALFSILILNWIYIIDNGVSQWLGRGMVVSTLRGMYKPALIPYYLVKECVDRYRIKRVAETDPYTQSLFRALDAVKIVGRRSFADLDNTERRKVVMKCAEAYALVTLPSAEPPDGNDESFLKYLSGLRTVVRTEHVTANVKQVDHALAMIVDHLRLYDSGE
jgi:hypothetical protein